MMATPRIHLDTDFGGDIDDLCALALLLRWPEPVAITGITVVAENDGRRTGMLRQTLVIAGREDIPTAGGASADGGFYPYPLGLPDESRYWPDPVIPITNPLDDALDLLRRSIDAGATIVGIGPLTNLRLLEEAHPGTLAQLRREGRLVQMGGYVRDPRDGYPAWTQADDFNIQVDVASARTVFREVTPTFVPLSVTIETSLRWAHLDTLRGGDPLAQLIARQAVAFAADERLGETYGATCTNLPDDLINFHHDPLAVAIALGWREGVTIETLPVRHVVEEGVIRTIIAPDGVPTPYVTAIDGPAFDRFWLETICRD